MNHRIFRSPGVQRKLFSLLIALSLIILPLGTVFFNARASTPPVPSASFTAQVVADSGSAPLTLRVPENANVGEQVTFVLEGVDLQDVAGFQAVLRFDPAALKFSGASLSEEFSQSGGSPMKVGPAVFDGSVLLAGASCPVAECTTTTQYADAVRQKISLSGSLPLGSFTFVVLAPGEHAVQVTDTELVDASGKVLFSAQPVSQKFTAATAELKSLDLTRNLFVNDSDASVVSGNWAILFEAGGCGLNPGGNPYDLDGSGCYNIADVQTVLAHWGQDTRGGSLLMAPEAVSADLTLTVTSDGDTGDASPNGVCDDGTGACTLRAAIQEANTNYGQTTINFNIRNPDNSCPDLVTIEVGTVLEIDNPYNDPNGPNPLIGSVIIDGYSQCNAKANTEPVTGNAVIKIELSGPRLIAPVDDPVIPPTEYSGLWLHSSSIEVRGLAIYDFQHQVLIRGTRANYNKIQGNFIGTNAASTYRNTWTSNRDADGLRFHFDGQYNLIGGTQPEDRNLVSGALQDGIGMRGENAKFNTIIGNYIGMAQNGTTRRANGSDGVDLGDGANNNQIGGLNPGERNVISGNGNDGIEFSHDPLTTNNQIVGNLIGVSADANPAVDARNNWNGIVLEDEANGNTVHRNVIAGNGTFGIGLTTGSNETITENFIGAIPKNLAASGYVVPNPVTISEANLDPKPNGQRTTPDGELLKSGIYITGGSQHNLIQRNLIAFNPHKGVYLDADEGFDYIDNRSCMTYFNTLSENRIFNNFQQGIFFRPDNCTPDPTIFYPNENIQPPVITSANTSTVAGTACNNCTVELFLSDKTSLSGSETAGEGKMLVGKGLANGSGQFSIAVSGLAKDDIVTGTSTDDKGNTSEFALNVLVSEGPPVTVTPTPVTPTPVTPTVTVTPDPDAEHIYLPVIRR